MNRSGRFDKDSMLATGAKAVSVLLVVASIALFTTHAPLPTGELALVPQAAVQQGASESSTVAPPASPTATEAAKRGTRRGANI
jgi:hypothetical protein